MKDQEAKFRGRSDEDMEAAFYRLQVGAFGGTCDWRNKFYARAWLPTWSNSPEPPAYTIDESVAVASAHYNKHQFIFPTPSIEVWMAAGHREDQFPQQIHKIALFKELGERAKLLPWEERNYQLDVDKFLSTKRKDLRNAQRKAIKEKDYGNECLKGTTYDPKMMVKVNLLEEPPPEGFRMNVQVIHKTKEDAERYSKSAHQNKDDEAVVIHEDPKTLPQELDDKIDWMKIGSALEYGTKANTMRKRAALDQWLKNNENATTIKILVYGDQYRQAKKKFDAVINQKRIEEVKETLRARDDDDAMGTQEVSPPEDPLGAFQEDEEAPGSATAAARQESDSDIDSADIPDMFWSGKDEKQRSREAEAKSKGKDPRR
jgi:hypothetical protein